MKYLKVILIVLVVLVTTGCFESKIEKKKITNNAIDYFSKKYNFNKKNIKIKENNFYGENEFCMNDCGENEATIMYNKKEYIIRYNMSNQSYGDNYQYEKIYNDLNKYLKDEFPFATEIKIGLLEEDVFKISQKYDNNIENYMKTISEQEYIYTDIDIWIKAMDANEATNLKNQYANIIISKLEKLNIDYAFNIAEKENDNEYFAFYFCAVSNGVSPSFIFKDNINKTSKKCDRNTISISDNNLICHY